MKYKLIWKRNNWEFTKFTVITITKYNKITIIFKKKNIWDTITKYKLL